MMLSFCQFNNGGRDISDDLFAFKCVKLNDSVHIAVILIYRLFKESYFP